MAKLSLRGVDAKTLAELKAAAAREDFLPSGRLSPVACVALDLHSK